MQKFKMGDKFRLKDETKWGGLWAGVMTVTEVVPDSSWCIRDDNHPVGPSAFRPEEIELVKVSGRASRASHPVNQTVLKHLRKRKSISPVEALVTYGISRLAPAIHDLRSAGHKITTQLRKDAKGHRYARYALVLA